MDLFFSMPPFFLHNSESRDSWAAPIEKVIRRLILLFAQQLRSKNRGAAGNRDREVCATWTGASRLCARNKTLRFYLKRAAHGMRNGMICHAASIRDGRAGQFVFERRRSQLMRPDFQ